MIDRLRVKSIEIQDLFMFLLFGVGLINRIALMAWLLHLILRSIQSVYNAIDSLLLIAFRTVLNPQITINVSAAQSMKWVAIFVISGMILLNTLKIQKEWRVKNSIILVAAFSVFVMVLSLANSNYPIVSIFKCFSYCFVFISVIMGIDSTCSTVDWINVIYRYFTAIFLLSAILSPFPFSYYSSARWFMGITNQSQMFAIMAVLYLAILIYRMINGIGRTFDFMMLSGTAIMTYFSGSRTGIISASICILYAFYFEVFKNKHYSIAIIAIFAIVVVLVMGYGDVIANIARTALLKGQADSPTATVSLETITSSRYKQFLVSQTKFNNDPLFGSGFMVPFTPGVKSWDLSFNLIVESGNLFYAILGDIGIVGLCFFIVCYGYIFASGEKKGGRIILFAAPVLICMGEMVFFSTNNNAIILYAMLACYICKGNNYQMLESNKKGYI